MWKEEGNIKYIEINHVNTVQKLIEMIAERDKKIGRNKEIQENIQEKTWEIKNEKEK
jgi:hypothetical protein